MKNLLLAVALVFAPLLAFGQAAYQRNAATTNNPARVQNVLLTTPSTNLYPVLVQKPDGTGGDRILQYAPEFFMSNGIGHFTNSIPIRFPGLSSNTLLRIDAGFGVNNVIGGITNTITKWTGTGTIGTSSLTDDGTNLAYNGSGTVSAQNGAFTNSLKLNGAAVLTNAPGGTQVFTNDAGVIHPVDLTVQVLQLGTDNIIGFGMGSFAVADLDSNTDVFAFGRDQFYGAALTNNVRVFLLGDFSEGQVWNDNLAIYGFGHNALGDTIISDSSEVYSYGDSSLADTTVVQSQELHAYGQGALGNSYLEADSQLFAYGNSALYSSALTNSSDIYAFGDNAGSGLSGDSLSHIFILGSNGQATNSNDYVFGDSAYNYFFPGASATFGGIIVQPGVDNTANLGTNGARWLNVWSYGLDVDGDIRVSGNISPRDVPYIWPVTQGDTNTILVNDGTGVLSWEPRTNAPVVIPTGTATYLAGGSSANALVGVGIGSGLAMSGTNLTATATGSGVTEDVTTLGWSGTNITGFNCATNFQGYYLLATNNFHFGSSTFSNLPTKTQLRNFTLCIQMDSTGGRIGSFTNSVVGWSLGSTNAPFIETNANAVSYVYFHTDMTTNSTLVATFNMDVRR